MRDKVFSKKVFIKTVTENVKSMYRKTLEEASQQEIFQAVSLAVKDVVMDQWMATQQVIERDDPKTVYYMSMEFLMGRALGNNMINLLCYDEVRETFVLDFDKNKNTWCDIANEDLANLKKKIYGLYGLYAYDRPGARTKYGYHGPSRRR